MFVSVTADPSVFRLVYLAVEGDISNPINEHFILQFINTHSKSTQHTFGRKEIENYII